MQIWTTLVGAPNVADVANRLAICIPVKLSIRTKSGSPSPIVLVLRRDDQGPGLAETGREFGATISI